jgi:hypothetical protein
MLFLPEKEQHQGGTDALPGRSVPTRRPPTWQR